MSEGVDWTRLDELLDEALEVPAAEREAWLDARFAGEPEVRGRLAQLLRLADDENEPLLPGAAPDALVALGLRPAAAAAARALEPGQRLGRYEVRGLLGTGGMGRVYRALDPVLGRDVAIKALADEVRDDPASLRRFEQEARALANLNHPNVATIYGFELLDGAPYLVLELVEGETLQDRLARGHLPRREAVDVARQVAEGLEEAHHKGLVHRDLKPSNVMLGPGGRVKLLDFGIAKSVERASGGAAVTATRTAPGAVFGTAPYMSPEQIRGEAVDARTDIWAFGCLLYEMLAGRRAFPGAPGPELLAAVLRDDVDFSALPEDTPAAVRRLVERCLRKDRRQRLQDIGDARIELAEVEIDATAPRDARPQPRPRWRWLVWPLVAAGLAAALAWVALRARDRPREPTTLRLSLDFPAGFTLADDYGAPFAISPDGSRLAVLGRTAADGPARLFRRDVGSLELVELPGTEGAWLPFFSPAGDEVGFFADRKLKKVGIDGSPAVVVADVGGNARGASWAPDGSIVFAPSQTAGLMRVREATAPEPLTQLGPEEKSHRWPQVLPAGEWVLFTVEEGEDEPYDSARLEAVSLATGERRRLLSGGAYARGLASGHLVFVRAGRLFAVRFDDAAMQVHGEPVPVLEGIRYDPRNGAAHLAVSASGTLVYGPGIPTSLENYLDWVAADGSLTRLVETPRIFREPRLSPDGRRVAMGIGPSGRAELWFLDLTSGTLSPGGLAGTPHRPTWRPDGSAVTVAVERAGRWHLLTVAADGTGAASTVLAGPHRLYPSAWSPDGRLLVYQERRPETGWDLYVVEVDAAGARVGEPRPLAATRFHEANASLSADGRWVAYESDELDAIVGIYVRAFPAGGEKVRASAGGGRWPRWGAGADLFYWHSFVGGLERIGARVEGGRYVVAGEAPVWPSGGAEPARRLVVKPGYEGYDVDPTVPRFLMLETAAEALEPPLRRPVVVLDWASELRDRVR